MGEQLMITCGKRHGKTEMMIDQCAEYITDSNLDVDILRSTIRTAILEHYCFKDAILMPVYGWACHDSTIA